MGFGAGYNASQKTDAVNSMALGNGAYNTLDNQVVIGNTSVTQTILNGNVGIGTTSPTYRLDVAGSGASGTARFFDQTASTGATLVTITPGAAQTSASTILSVGGVASVVGLTFNGHACSLVAGVVTCP